jgi:light-regulated signal transduction histidine kinase (bacteriophytochrome)
MEWCRNMSSPHAHEDDVDPRWQALLEQIKALLGGDLSARGLPGGGGDEADSVISALNMLAIDMQERELARVRAEEAHASAMARVRELERANEALEEFAYIASHDLQEPLRMVKSYTDLLAQKFGDKLGEEGKIFAFYAGDGARRMQQLLHDLLAYARVGRTTAPAAVELMTVVGEVLRDLAVVIAETHAQVSYSGLPTLLGDREQLGSVFRNLIGNALKYRGSEPPRVQVSARRERDGWLFSVRDNGLGIAPQHQERIFKIFQRLHGRDQYTGTGIGLALCKRIVESHGGRIWVESQEGQGSTFWFTVPVDGALGRPMVFSS